MIKKVLDDVLECHLTGEVHKPARKPGQGGHSKLIQLGYVEEQIAADCVEGGLGLTQTAHQVNAHRRQCDPLPRFRDRVRVRVRVDAQGENFRSNFDRVNRRVWS